MTFTLVLKKYVLPVGGFNHDYGWLGGPGINDHADGVIRAFCDMRRWLHDQRAETPTRFSQTDLVEGDVTCLACIAQSNE